MENKLEQLTQKLRQEGLDKGRAEAEALVVEANAKADKIVAEAQQKADKILADAKTKAEELTRNTANDVRMASLKTISALRLEIENLIVAKVVEPQISKAWESGEFIQTLLVEAVKSWSPEGETGIEVVVPEAMLEEVKAIVAKEFKSGVDVSASSAVKVPFRISDKAEGYFVSFSDEDFATMIKQALRPKIAEFIFAQ